MHGNVSCSDVLGLLSELFRFIMCHCFIKMVIGLFIQLDSVPGDKTDSASSEALLAARQVKIPREADFLTYSCDMNNRTLYYGNYQCLLLI